MPPSPRDAEARVPLGALSVRQRRQVERRLWLVRAAIKRHMPRRLLARPQREYADLAHQGVLALVEAVRAHDPARHGAFNAYAVARIHFAISRYVHEDEPLIRVPFITQRRQRAARGVDDAARRGPDAVPRVLRFAGPNHPSSDILDRRRTDPHDPASCEPTVGDLIRQRVDAAVARTAEIMMNTPGRAPGRLELIERCRDGRWTIPDPDVRTPIRDLARTLKCSIGRVTRCEETFRTLTARRLTDDASFQRLLRLARTSPGGLEHRPTPTDLGAVRSRDADEAEHGVAGAPHRGCSSRDIIRVAAVEAARR